MAEGEILNAHTLRRDDILGAIAVIVLLIGTATGKRVCAARHVGYKAILLPLFTGVCLGTGAILAAFAAAVTAAIIGIVVSMR